MIQSLVFVHFLKKDVTMNKWVVEIVEILEKLGGSASLKEIYLMIEKRNDLPLNDYKDWRSVVRKNI